MPRGQLPATHLVPLMRYRDVGVASEWLCAAFGFEPHFAAKAPDGAVFYAELRLGDSMIMLGPIGDVKPGAAMDDALSASVPAHTQTCYVVLDDVDVHYERAKRAGATMTLDIKSDDLGGRGYSCEDLEGHTWNFGTYDPFKAKGAKPRKARAAGSVASLPGLKPAIAATLVVSMFSGWLLYGHMRGPGEATLLLERLREALLGPRTHNGLSTGGIDASAEKARQDAYAARSEASSARRAMAALKQELEQERRARTEALDAAQQAEAETSAAKSQADAKSADVDRAKIEAQRIKSDAEAVIQSQAEQLEAERKKASHAEAERTALLKQRDQSEAAQRQALVEQSPEKATASRIAAIERELVDARNARDVAQKAAADAESTAAKDRAIKDDALRALADAGAKIATLEVELRTAKSQLAQAQAAQLRRLRTQAAKPKKDPNKAWPYSEW